MSIRNAFSIIAASLILVSSTTLSAQDPKSDGHSKSGKSTESVSVLHKMFPDYDAYHLDYDAYEKRRIEDLVEMNVTLYDLSPDERARVSSLIEKLDKAPIEKEIDKAAADEFRFMINQRAEIVKSLSTKFDIDKAESKVAQEMLDSSGLVKFQPSIARHEAARNDALSQIYPAIEAMIGPERAAQAHAQWDYRLLEAREKIAIKTLVDTLARPEELQRKAEARRPSARRNASKPTAMRPVSPKRTTPPRKRPDADVRSRTPDAKDDAKSSAKAGNPKATKRTTPRTRRTTPAAKAEKPVPLDKWEQYVRDFLKDYECTPEQTHAALSILGELKERAKALESANKKRLEAANDIKDRRERQDRIDAINAPIDRLFDQLKRRLEGLLTTHQRAIKKAAESKAAQKPRK